MWRRMVRRFLNPFPHTGRTNPAGRFRPSVTTLEAREVPACVLAQYGSVLDVYGTPGDDTVTLSRVGGGALRVEHSTGTEFPARGDFTGVTLVRFYGGEGNDRLYGGYGDSAILAYGGNGHDILRGGSRNDILYGEGYYDDLYGGAGNDKLYGGENPYDWLYGEAGNDWLDAGSGSASEVVEGGADRDFNAYVTAVSGATQRDVNQRGTPTCWVLAPMAAAVHRGIDLSARIQYLGNDTYRVSMYEDVGRWGAYQDVNFDGTLLAHEPAISEEGESWAVITHRALLQRLGMNWRDPATMRCGWPDDPMKFLTGRATDTTANTLGFNPHGADDRDRIIRAAEAGQLVTACTYAGDFGSGHVLGSVTTNKLVGNHCYAVQGIHYNFGTGGYDVILYNPWGYDGAAAVGDTGDGYVTVTWEQFAGSFYTFHIN